MKHNKTKQIKQNKTRQHKTKQNKPKQNKTKQTKQIKQTKLIKLTKLTKLTKRTKLTKLTRLISPKVIWLYRKGSEFLFFLSVLKKNICVAVQPASNTVAYTGRANKTNKLS